MNYPITWIFLSLCLGALLENVSLVSFPALFALLVLAVVLEFVFYRFRKYGFSRMLLLVCFVILAMLGFRQALDLRFSAAGIEQGEYFFAGKVVSFPIVRENFVSYKVLVEKAGSKKHFVRVKDYALVKDYGVRDVKFGSRIVFKGRLDRFAHGRFVRYVIWVKKKALWRVLQPPSIFENTAAVLSAGINRKFDTYLSVPARDFLLGVFLGRREFVPWQVRSYFINSGTAHILAVSGLHVGMVYFLAGMSLGILGLRRKLRYILLIPLLAIYAFMCGLRPPVVRAVLMAVIYCLYYILERKPLILCSLALAGIIIFLFNPLEYAGISFMLSFLAVAGLIIGFKVVKPLRVKNIFLRRAEDLLLGSLWVNIFIFPILSHFFGHFCFSGIVANLAVIPFLFLILAFTFVFLLFSFIPPAGQILGVGLSFMVGIFIKLAWFLSWQGRACFPANLNFWQVLGYYLILGLLIISIVKGADFIKYRRAAVKS